MMKLCVYSIQCNHGRVQWNPQRMIYEGYNITGFVKGKKWKSLKQCSDPFVLLNKSLIWCLILGWLCSGHMTSTACLTNRCSSFAHSKLVKLASPKHFPFFPFVDLCTFCMYKALLCPPLWNSTMVALNAVATQLQYISIIWQVKCIANLEILWQQLHQGWGCWYAGFVLINLSSTSSKIS